MKYTREGDKVTLEMTADDYAYLLIALGFALGAMDAIAAEGDDKRMFWGLIRFANELNQTNPHFTQYEIPEEFTKAGAK